MHQITYEELIKKVAHIATMFPVDLSITVTFQTRARPEGSTTSPIYLPTSGFRYKMETNGWTAHISNVEELRKMLEGMYRSSDGNFPAGHLRLGQAVLDIREEYEGPEKMVLVISTGRRVSRLHVRDERMNAQTVTDHYTFDLLVSGYRA